MYGSHSERLGVFEMSNKYVAIYECGLGHGPGKSYCEGEGHKDGQAYILVPVGYITGMGDPMFNVHSPDVCKGEACVIHNPSDHPMKDFPTHWRPKIESYEIGYPLMERICPHGIGHPDPDHITWVRKVRGDKSAEGDASHGCDGCCTGEGPAVEMGHNSGRVSV